jgi:hypothetical protein
MKNLKQRISSTMKQLVTWLVAGDYDAIEKYTGGVRLSANLISVAIFEYGHKLVMPPTDIFENLYTVEVIGASPRKWHVEIDLWTEDDGRSDWTLECTFIDSQESLLKAEVDNLHML